MEDETSLRSASTKERAVVDFETERKILKTVIYKLLHGEKVGDDPEEHRIKLWPLKDPRNEWDDSMMIEISFVYFPSDTKASASIQEFATSLGMRKNKVEVDDDEEGPMMVREYWSRSVEGVHIVDVLNRAQDFLNAACGGLGVFLFNDRGFRYCIFD